MLRKTVVAVLTVGTLAAAGCTPTIDETYCEDVADAQNAVEQYGSIDRVEAREEIMEDLNEMGATNRCPGFSPAGADRDG